jgi:zinc finger CCCH domain-containing protein 13
MSMLVRNTSPTRRPVVSNSSRDDKLASRPPPYVVREEPPRYLVPASTHPQGREHHQRHYSATRADADRLNVGSRVGGRAKGEYHPAGGYGQKSYSSSRPSVKDDDYSYTGPREQFARDMQARAPPVRESYLRRDRPLSVVEIPDSKPPAPVRREMGPPPIPRQLERLDRPEDRRSSTRPIYEDERAGEVPSRRHSVRAPVVHQLRDSGYASRDDVDIRPKPRRDRIEEEEPLPRLRTRDLERERDYSRDLERDRDTRDRDRDRDREREPDRDRDREKDWERPRGHEKLKHADDRREIRSRDNSPERSGVGKGIATGLGGAAIAGLAGAALKGSSKPDDASDSDSRRERRHRKHKHRDRVDDEIGPRELEPLERRPAAPLDDRGHDERSRPLPKPDESASESYEDEHQRRRHRRRKHKDRDDADTGDVLDPRSAAADPPRSDRELAEPEDDGRYRRRPERPSSRTREPEVPELERRTVPPGEDEDDRPRRVLLVEPEKKEEFKPRGILKAPRRVPFPEDPNPTREGVAPLKDVGKDGVPNGARWTKISRVLVNPEALEKAQERFEERDDYVIVLRVVTREEIQKFAEKTREIRGKLSTWTRR